MKSVVELMIIFDLTEEFQLPESTNMFVFSAEFCIYATK